MKPNYKAIAFLGATTAFFLISLWMGFQVLAPSINEFTYTLQSIPNFFALVAVAVGITFVFRTFFQ